MKARKNEKTDPRKTGKPMSQKINARYIGWLSFE
jgi:hypothetical protein